MTTLAKIGWGATVSVGDPLVELAEIIAIGVPEDTVDTVEATHFGSPQARREFIAGLIDSGEAEFGMNLAAGSATDTKCRTLHAAREAVDYMIALPTPTGTWEIEGQFIVTGYARDVPLDDRMVATLRVKFTGATTEAAGA